LKLKDGILASLIGIVKDLEEFAARPNDDEEQRLRSIADRSDPRIRSLMLSRLEQIKKKKEDKVDREDPSTVSAKRKADPRTVKGKNSRKSNCNIKF
jgi:hypothetical protein